MILSNGLKTTLFFIKRKLWSFEIGSTNSGFCSYRTDKIQNIHQLQNLYFALTGEELTIKL